MLKNCENCGNDKFHLGRDDGGEAGLFCSSCKQGFSLWSCACRAENPIKHDNLILEKKGLCFIATAVYGIDDAPEIHYLSSFRDEVLIKSNFGKIFVFFYYKVSPYFAKIIYKSETLKKFVKTLIIIPMINMLKIFWKN